MNKTNIRKWLYHAKHDYLTLNNVVLGVALLIAFSWVWGSISTMQQNFALQKDVDMKRRELELTELEVATLEYQKNYYQSDEYRELAAREKLGLALPGEKLLVLPPNSDKAKQEQAAATTRPAASGPSNLELWTNFLFGHNLQSIDAGSK